MRGGSDKHALRAYAQLVRRPLHCEQDFVADVAGLGMKIVIQDGEREERGIGGGRGRGHWFMSGRLVGNAISGWPAGEWEEAMDLEGRITVRNEEREAQCRRDSRMSWEINYCKRCRGKERPKKPIKQQQS